METRRNQVGQNESEREEEILRGEEDANEDV